MGFMPCFALTGFLLFAGCHEGTELSVTSAGDGRLTISVNPRRANFRACIDQASILPADSDETHPAWEAGRTDPRHCAQRLGVGAETAGFLQRASAPLASDTHYCAVVRGPGFSEHKSFLLHNGKAVGSPPADPDPAY